jgi:hypothetical protein
MEKLEIPKNQWNEWLAAAEVEVINIDPGIKSAAYLGIPTPMHEGIYLSLPILQELAALEIKPQAQAYSKGLLSIRKDDGGRYNMVELDEYLLRRLEQMPEDTVSANWLYQLILAAKLLQLLLHEHLYLENKLTSIELLVKEQDKIYAQIACYCLPPLFLKSLRNPTVFLEFIAPKLGRYLLLKTKG